MSDNSDDAGLIAIKVVCFLREEFDPPPSAIVMARALAYTLGNVVGAFSNQPGERFDEIVASFAKVILDRAHYSRNAVEEEAREHAH
jgi:hypothetical protein